MAIQYSFERYEKKYFLTPEQQALLLERLRERMTPDEYGAYTLCNIYYDTDDWRLIRASLAGGGYKEKLRVRSYGVPAADGNVFVELTRKCGGVVYKRRISVAAGMAEPLVLASAGLTPAPSCGPASREGGSASLDVSFGGGPAPASHMRGSSAPGASGLWTPDGASAGADVPALADCGQVGRELDWFERTYRAYPRVFIGYDRQALAGREDAGLRVTFDTNLRYRLDALDLRAGDYGAPLLPDGRILMEIKIPGVCPLWLSRSLSELDIRPASFSKYGACYREHILPKVFSHALHNNTKEALLSA